MPSAKAPEFQLRAVGAASIRQGGRNSRLACPTPFYCGRIACQEQASANIAPRIVLATAVKQREEVRRVAGGGGAAIRDPASPASDGGDAYDAGRAPAGTAVLPRLRIHR